MELWYITDETPQPEGEGPGCSLICLAKNKQTALRYLRDEILGPEYFQLLVWQLSADNPDYYYGYGEWDGKEHYYMLCTEEVLEDATEALSKE